MPEIQRLPPERTARNQMLLSFRAKRGIFRTDLSEQEPHRAPPVLRLDPRERGENFVRRRDQRSHTPPVETKDRNRLDVRRAVSVSHLVHYETTDNAYAAIAREKQIKSWRRAKKVDLIESTNLDWRDLAIDWGLPSSSTPTLDPSSLRSSG